MYEFKSDIKFNDGGLDELLALDRYAVSTFDPHEMFVGDKVVVITDPLKDERKVARIISIEYSGEGDDYLIWVRTIDGKDLTVKSEYVHKPLETTPQEFWARWAKGAAGVEETEEKRIEAENRYRELLDGYAYSPGGRIQLMLGQEFVTGKKAQLTAYNCFSGETIVQTVDGPRQIKDLVGKTVNVLSQDGVYRRAYFDAYGVQKLLKVILANGEEIYATPDHEWIIANGGNYKRAKTTELEGKTVPVISRRPAFKQDEVIQGIRHGIVYGDGTIARKNNSVQAHVLLFGEKKSLIEFFAGYHTVPHYNDQYIGVYGLDPYWKSVPDDDASPSYWYGFVVGLIATDGHCDNRGSVMIHSCNLDDLKKIARNLYKTGFVHASITQTRELIPFNGKYAPVYKLQLIKQTIQAEDLLRASHRENFVYSLNKKEKRPTIKIVKIEDTDREEVVYCCNEPETHSFVVGTGYLTGNCYVIPNPKGSNDPIEQWMHVLDSAKVEMDIMRRGGGVGLNLSDIETVRGAKIKKSDIFLCLNSTHKDFDEFVNKNDIGKFDHVMCHSSAIEVFSNKEVIYLDVGDSIEELVQAMKDMVIYAYNGYTIKLDFSNLRPRNSIVKGVNGRSSGAASWMEMFDLIASLLQQETIDAVDFAEIFSAVVHLIQQGGSRRGALMLVLNDSRRDILEKFITRKRTPGKLTGANVSVGISDSFMERVLMSGTEEERLWNLIIESAHASAEPGVVWLETMNKWSNSWYFSELVATNP